MLPEQKSHSTQQTDAAEKRTPCQGEELSPIQDDTGSACCKDGKDAASRHISVLLDEVLSFFEPKPGMRCIDATLGMGGHSEALLLKAEKAGCADIHLLGLDRDVDAISLATERLAAFGERFTAKHVPFDECAEAVEDMGWDGVDFILADIGVSSMQLDLSERGFSFIADGPLDMRMDTTCGKSAETLVNEAPVLTLKDIIKNFGEEPMAGRIARAIDSARARRHIDTTLELAHIVEMAYPAKWRATSRNHPATRTFQALRMAVNDELGQLERFLQSAVPLLRPGGRIAVISFHSLEDRIVKHFFRDEATGCRCPSYIPVCVCGIQPKLSILTKKPVLPTPEEEAANPRSRSAKLRVAQKTDLTATTQTPACDGAALYGQSPEEMERIFMAERSLHSRRMAGKRQKNAPTLSKGKGTGKDRGRHGR